MSGYSVICSIFKINYLSKKSIVVDPHFLYLELYNEKNVSIFSHKVKNFTQIKKELNQYNHKFIQTSNANIKESILHNHIQNRFYFKFSRPFINENNIGRIEGLYAISKQDVENIYINIFYSILQVIISISLTTLMLYPIIVYLNKNYIKQSKELLKANLEILSVLGGTISKRDSETDSHNYRVTIYTLEFAKILSLDEQLFSAIIKGAFLHDIGKIGIADNILLKQGKLNSIEFEQMKLHVLYGKEIIKQSSYLNEAFDIVAYHHEHYDGSGYLSGLKGEEIPILARVFTICDVFDALTTKRPYKEELSFKESIDIIKQGANTLFDPNLVDIFCNHIEPIYNKIANLDNKVQLHQLLSNEFHYLDKVN